MKTSTLAAQAGAGADAATHITAIGRAAVVALHDELALAPKPGLVSFADSGSHRDMDARTFMRSLFALRTAFPGFVALGARHAPFAALEHAGIVAEQRMLKATNGINTHRGAVFTLGLLCAAAGRLLARGETLQALAVRRSLVDAWGEALHARALRPRGSYESHGSHGSRAARRFGLRSAGSEAAAGFPVLFESAWPALRDALRRGLTLQQARLDAMFAAMAVLDDTNLAHRGGLAGLRLAQRAAADYLAAGGSARPDALEHAQALHRAFVARNLSPGGTADILSACCWLQRVCAAAP